MPKQLHIRLRVDLKDDDWGTEKATIKPLYDQFKDGLTAAGITFVDETKTSEIRPRKPKLEAVTTTAAPPAAA
jgi:hypothetical protein